MPNDPFYKTMKWRKCRAQYMAAHPICCVSSCNGAATHVDHHRSRRLGGADFEWGNLRGYCRTHHNEKTNAIDGGFGRAPKANFEFSAKGADLDGNPISQKHHWNNE